MAQPRVFISSTCYDLGEVRHSLEEFLKGFGYGVVLSEEGDVYYNPDFHTHDSCINEIPTCNLFILIIGGRHGGKYVGDKTKSITNAEYQKAKDLNIPIFTFVKKDVIADHRVFQKNKDKGIDIEYPSIEKQENSKAIFKFIDEIRLADKNNDYFVFENFSEIRDILKKQFAGMMYDYLLNRNKHNEYERTNKVLDNLTLLQKKTEEIAVDIYKVIDAKNATKRINDIEKEILAKEFFMRVIAEFYITNPKIFASVKMQDLDFSKLNWINFLLKVPGFEYTNDVKVYSLDNSFKSFEAITYEDKIFRMVQGDLDKSSKSKNNELSSLFENFVSLDILKKEEILKNL